jgi:hypothetical protein
MRERKLASWKPRISKCFHIEARRPNIAEWEFGNEGSTSRDNDVGPPNSLRAVLFQCKKSLADAQLSLTIESHSIVVLDALQLSHLLDIYR